MKEEEIIARIQNLIDYIEFKPDRKYNAHFAIIAYPEEQWFQAIQALLDLYKNSISKDKIRNLILKYRCFGWHDKDDEYWANRILDGFEELLSE